MELRLGFKIGLLGGTESASNGYARRLQTKRWALIGFSVDFELEAVSVLPACEIAWM
jgi:hypothetical protein